MFPAPFSKYLIITYYVLVNILSTGDNTVSKNLSTALMEFVYSMVGDKK